MIRLDVICLSQPQAGPNAREVGSIYLYIYVYRVCSPQLSDRSTLLSPAPAHANSRHEREKPRAKSIPYVRYRYGTNLSLPSSVFAHCLVRAKSCCRRAGDIDVFNPKQMVQLIAFKNAGYARCACVPVVHFLKIL